jgi:hypothetical protein
MNALVTGLLGLMSAVTSKFTSDTWQIEVKRFIRRITISKYLAEGDPSTV